MELAETIFRRKSVRSFDPRPLSGQQLAEIAELASAVRPLDPTITTSAQIVGADAIRCQLPWRSPHYLVLFSERKPGYLLNLGFAYQQLELELQDRGIGVCWLGLGRFAPTQADASDLVRLAQVPGGCEFVIMWSFGRANGAQYRSASGFKRKRLDEISDRPDERLEVVRVAPSARNSQPWYFTHVDDRLDVYCTDEWVDRVRVREVYRPIDMGIALAHLYVANSQTFAYFTVPDAPVVSGHRYVGSVRI